MNREITESCPLLAADGTITREGWARRPYWRYDRSAVRAHPFRIKEWDYYAILSPENRYGVTLTVSDLGYAGLYALCLLDFNTGTFVQADDTVPLTRHRTGLLADADQSSLDVHTKQLHLAVAGESGERRISFSAPEMVAPGGERGVQGEVVLAQPSALESMNIATSWAQNRRAFYYNRKINCMPASGTIRLGASREIGLGAEGDFGTLDWGRGRWIYRNRWYWSSLSTRIAGTPFGFNLGYGFTDRSPASENTLLYGSTIHKLGDVVFDFDPDDVMTPWRMSDDEGRLDVTMEPVVDRASDVNLGIIVSKQHQVFGNFSGYAVLDDGTRLELDRELGFAEDVLNRW